MTHLVAHLTPSTAFPLLLASFVFPELHAEIKVIGPVLLVQFWNISDGVVTSVMDVKQLDNVRFLG